MLAAIIIVSLIAFFILILCVPVDFKVDWDSQRKPKSHFKVTWLFGALGREFRRNKRVKRRKKKQIKTGFIDRLKRIQEYIQIIEDRKLLKQILQFVKDLFSRFRLKYYDADVRVGLGDPYDTGLLFSAIYSIMTLIPFSGHYIRRTDLQPDFSGNAVFEGRLQVLIRVLPISLVIPVIRFIFSPAVITAAYTLISKRWKKRKYMLSYQP